MSDYSAKVYREQGGNLVVGSSGSITVTGGGRIVGGVVTGATGTALKNYGIASVSSTMSTTGTTKKYTLTAPVAGTEVIIHAVTVSGTSTPAYVDCGSGVYASATTNHRYIRMGAANSVAILKGLTTTRWLIASSTGTVATTTSATG